MDPPDSSHRIRPGARGAGSAAGAAEPEGLPGASGGGVGPKFQGHRGFFLPVLGRGWERNSGLAMCGSSLLLFFLLFLEAMGGSGSFERRRLQVKLLCFIPDFGIVRPRSPA